MKITGRWVATVTLDIAFDPGEIEKQDFNRLHDHVCYHLDEELQDLLEDELGADGVTITVSQQYADLTLEEQE